MELLFDPRRRCLKRRRASPEQSSTEDLSWLNMMIRGGVRGGKRRFQARTTSGSLRHDGGDKGVVSHRIRSLKRRTPRVADDGGGAATAVMVSMCCGRRRQDTTLDHNSWSVGADYRRQVEDKRDLEDAGIRDRCMPACLHAKRTIEREFVARSPSAHISQRKRNIEASSRAGVLNA
ncbi:hypothetical protein F2Q69_00037391 [Brassica cretica]|uniref:Uncharacterized protein n=1 Tax=Brassica cretica TaxID=69181 RepID=A0A8S9SI42_BRACR|nr:hypothetical protein F2Q69_00037391 [Brassica cretica]